MWRASETENNAVKSFFLFLYSSGYKAAAANLYQQKRQQRNQMAVDSDGNFDALRSVINS